MLKVASRAQLDEVTGKRRPTAPPPAPRPPVAPLKIPAPPVAAAPVKPPPAARAPLTVVPDPRPMPPAPDLSRLQASMEALARGITRTNELVAQQAQLTGQPAKPKQMEATVHRDSKGRMEKVVIIVI